VVAAAEAVVVPAVEPAAAVPAVRVAVAEVPEPAAEAQEADLPAAVRTQARRPTTLPGRQLPRREELLIPRALSSNRTASDWVSSDHRSAPLMNEP